MNAPRTNTDGRRTIVAARDAARIRRAWSDYSTEKCRSPIGQDLLGQDQPDRPRPARKLVAALEPSLHLAISTRSFLAESLFRFLNALVNGEAEAGRELFESFREQYRIVLTRSMRAARQWIRRQRRGTERAGLVASSSAQWLKPHAIDIRVNIDPVHWILSPAKDTRSSLYLTPSIHNFRGAKWTDVKKPKRRQYLKNAYRVLLTRARQGMINMPITHCKAARLLSMVWA